MNYLAHLVEIAENLCDPTETITLKEIAACHKNIHSVLERVFNSTAFDISNFDTFTVEDTELYNDIQDLLS